MALAKDLALQRSRVRDRARRVVESIKVGVWNRIVWHARLPGRYDEAASPLWRWSEFMNGPLAS
jgi:hypothetical protein